jgi:hypothetical protein
MMEYTFFRWQVEGGIWFMVPLSVMAVIIIALLLYVVTRLAGKKTLHPFWLESIKQIGGLAAAWGTFWTIAGLFQAFDALESSPDVIPFPVICGGMKVALLTVLYGLLIYIGSLIAYISVKLGFRNSLT